MKSKGGKQIMFQLNELIKEKGLTINKVMEIMDIPESTLRELRTCNKNVRLSQVQKVIKLHRYCGTKPTDILKIIENEGK